jgi:hypothetical protein
MRRLYVPFVLAAAVVAQSSGTWAEPVFVNGLVIPGNTLDATRQPGANGGRLGFFSDIYYDPIRDEWWAISDRGPGGGVLDYATRVQRFTIDVNRVTGRIANFRVRETIKFTDPKGLLSAPTNPRRRQSACAQWPQLGHSERGGRDARPQLRSRRAGDRSAHRPSARIGRIRPVRLRVQPQGQAPSHLWDPANLVPKVGDAINYVTDRDGGERGAPGQSGLRGPGHHARRHEALCRLAGSADQ